MASALEPAFIDLSTPLRSFARAPEKVAGTAQSRSTSAGSTLPPSPQQEIASVRADVAGSVQGLGCSFDPDFEYPLPLTIQNAVFHPSIGQPSSMDEFYQEREIQSCPPLAPPPGLEDFGDNPRFQLPSYFSAGDVFSATANLQYRYTAQPRLSQVPRADETRKLQPMKVAGALMAHEEPLLGSLEMPTFGSRGHYFGNCKPCAFFYKKGCESGLQCTFCHLCGPDEKKRRHKIKVAVRRQTRQRQGH